MRFPAESASSRGADRSRSTFHALFGACWLLCAGCGSAHDAGSNPGNAGGPDERREHPRTSPNHDEGAAGSISDDLGTSGAGEAGSGTTAPDDDPDLPASEELPFGFEPDPDNYVFDQNSVRQYEVEVDPAEWAQINETAYLEQYIKGKLTVEGEVVEPIGLRFKGFRGSLYNCFDFDDQGNSLGRTCTRLPLKISFDEYDDAGRFHGLKKLNFHAMRNDPSMMRERLGYWLFREFGVPAPRAVHALLVVNGEPLGLFSLVEEVDGRFARARFADGGKGNVYKERWPLSSADAEYFRSGLESNRSDPAVDVSPMVRFAEALMAADDATVEDVLREYTDFDALMRYLAVDRAINHWDGPTAFRCQPAEDVRPLPPEVFAAQTPPLGWEVCQNKNYFWYQEPGRDRIWLMAWDLDTALSSFSQFPDWNTEPAPCEVQQQGRPPRCDRLINWFATVLRPYYVRAGEELVAGPFQPDKLRAVAQPWYEQIAPLAGPGLFEIGASSLSSELDARYAAFMQDLQR